MSKWKPIETAPRDGTRIELWIPYTANTEKECADWGHFVPLEPREYDEWQVPRWAKDDGGCWRFDGDDGMFDIQPTKWR